MKTRTTYSKPIFFGWYVIGSSGPKKPSASIRAKQLSRQDLTNGVKHR